MNLIPVYTPRLTEKTSLYVNECIESGWISSRGAFIEKFEGSFAKYVGARDAVTVSNGTVAIHLALAALGIGPGDEVIVPTFTYIATVNMILLTGAQPVYVDSVADTLQIDPQAVRRAITRKTRAVMAVHLYGHPCDMDALVSICQENELLLVEDCAEAFGTRWNGRHVGTFGDIATFSFFGNKTITTGEGGMVLARDDSILARCRHLKSQGVSSSREYWHDVLAFNYRMTNIQAAIGLSQIEAAAKILEDKSRVAAEYAFGLKNLPLRTHSPVGNVTHSYWMCSIILDDSSHRDPLRAYLGNAGIDSRPFFPLCHKMPHAESDAQTPVAENLSKSGINLPSFPDLTSEQTSLVCKVISDYFDGR